MKIKKKKNKMIFKMKDLNKKICIKTLSKIKFKKNNKINYVNLHLPIIKIEK